MTCSITHQALTWLLGCAKPHLLLMMYIFKGDNAHHQFAFSPKEHLGAMLPGLGYGSRTRVRIQVSDS